MTAAARWGSIRSIRPGKQPDNEKIKTLVNLVLKFWRSKAIMEDTKQVVSLTKIICRYYEDIPDGHCFPDFTGTSKKGKKLYERLNILPEYFDIDSLHVCSGIYAGDFMRTCASRPHWRTICRTGFYRGSLS